ncbi:MAG: response regulator [Lachnospiraceae bacterium]|nr:response regulator [Lachnospiraceae bacterium]
MSMKVLIADDEEKVCQLIVHLVDWESLDMEVVAVTHNGIEALEAIRKWKPDIAITDIRMPGCNGLELIQESKTISPQMEFIIISGYRHFEYAQTAIRFGVKDYLLKPIKKEELNSTLKRMHDSYMERNKRLSQEEMYQITLQNNLDRLRAGLFSDVLLRKKIDVSELEIVLMNEKYHYQFHPGCFQVVVIKMDGVDTRIMMNQEFLQEKVLEAFNNRIREYCFDSEICLENYTCYAVLNYPEENSKAVRRVLKQILDHLLLQNDIFENLRVTIGSGSVENGIETIHRSMKTASLAAEERLLQGTNRVLECENQPRQSFAENALFYDFNQWMGTAVENLDEKAISNAIFSLKQEMLKCDAVSGHDILQMGKEIVQIYLFTVRKNKFPLHVDESWFEDYVRAIDSMSSVDEIFRYAEKTVRESFHELIQVKMAEDNRPIRMAKQYIKENFGSSITLEMVSSQAGFNPAYFSTMFKKETGATFSEYLLQVRIEAAKEMLRDTNLNISEICERVGYSDSKYFTKTFTREAGLKPNQYRKLYS